MKKIDLHIHTNYSDGTDDLDELLENLKKEGISCFSILSNMESVGKPHIAKVLIKMGLASDKDEAITKYLLPIKTSSTRLDAEMVIKAINASGGISVWAHPLGGEGETHLSYCNERIFFGKEGLLNTSDIFALLYISCLILQQQRICMTRFF